MLVTRRKSENRVRPHFLENVIIYVVLVLAQCWKPDVWGIFLELNNGRETSSLYVLYSSYLPEVVCFWDSYRWELSFTKMNWVCGDHTCLEQGCNEGYPRQKKIHGWKVSGVRLRLHTFILHCTLKRHSFVCVRAGSHFFITRYLLSVKI